MSGFNHRQELPVVSPVIIASALVFVAWFAAGVVIVTKLVTLP